MAVESFPPTPPPPPNARSRVELKQYQPYKGMFSAVPSAALTSPKNVTTVNASYSSQYTHMYSNRLKHAKGMLKGKCGEVKLVPRVIDLRAEDGEVCIIGLFARTCAKRTAELDRINSIICRDDDDFASNGNGDGDGSGDGDGNGYGATGGMRECDCKEGKPPEVLGGDGVNGLLEGWELGDSTDSFNLEDDSGVVSLTSSTIEFLSKNQSLIPGVPVLFRGSLKDGGKEGSEFDVKGIRYCFDSGEETAENFLGSSPATTSISESGDVSGEDTQYILLVSDIFVGGAIPAPPLPIPSGKVSCGTCGGVTAESASQSASESASMDVDEASNGPPAPAPAPANDHNDLHQLRLTLLREWLTGNLPHASGIDPKNVSRVVVAGGGVPPPILERGNIVPNSSADNSNGTTEQTLKAVKSLDLYLSMVASSVPVTLMPSGPPATPQSVAPPKGYVDQNPHLYSRGHNTPLPPPPPPLTNALLPQTNPIHGCLLPLSYSFSSSFSGVGNPVGFSVEGVGDGKEELWVGLSGGGVMSDIRGVTAVAPEATGDGKEDLRALSRMIKWGHLAPTAPSGVACYPSTTTDPLTLDSNEVDVLFCGGSPGGGKGGEVTVEGKVKRIVAVPRFYEKGEVMLVELGGSGAVRSLIFG